MSDLVNRLRHQASCLQHGQVEQLDNSIAALHDAVDRIEELEVQLAAAASGDAPRQQYQRGWNEALALMADHIKRMGNAFPGNGRAP